MGIDTSARDMIAEINKRLYQAIMGGTGYLSPLRRTPPEKGELGLNLAKLDRARARARRERFSNPRTRRTLGAHSRRIFKDPIADLDLFFKALVGRS